MIRSKNFKKIVTAVLAATLLTNFSAQSQNLTRYIPVDAEMVMVLDGGALAEKGQLATASQMVMMKEFNEALPELRKAFHLNKTVVTDLWQNTATYGLDLEAKSYFYKFSSDSAEHFSVAMKLADGQKFGSWLQSAVLPDYWEKPVESNGYKGIVLGIFGLRWNQDHLIVSWLEMSSEYYRENLYKGYSSSLAGLYNMSKEDSEEETEGDSLSTIDSLEMEQIEAEKPDLLKEIEAKEAEEAEKEEAEEEGMTYMEARKAKNEIQKGWLKDWLTAEVNNSKSSSIEANTQCHKALKQSADIGFWMKYQQQSPANQLGALAFSYPWLGSFLEGVGTSANSESSIYLSLNFEEEEVVFNFDFFLDPESYRTYRKTFRNKVNKDFRKYIRGNDLIAYYGTAIDVEGMVKGFREGYDPAIRQIPNYGSTMLDALELIDVALDEDDLYDLWNGDALFAWTGMKEFETTYISYDYDEDFNQVEVEKTKTEKRPELMYLMSTNDEESWQRIFNIGVSVEVLKDMGGYYLIEHEDLELDFDVYLALDDGVLIVTNDEELLKYNLPNGWVEGKRMTKEQMKDIRNGNSAMRLDIAALIKELPNMAPIQGEEATYIMTQWEQNFSAFRVEGFVARKRRMHTAVAVEMKSNPANSLFHLLKFSNNLFEYISR